MWCVYIVGCICGVCMCGCVTPDSFVYYYAVCCVCVLGMLKPCKGFIVGAVYKEYV